MNSVIDLELPQGPMRDYLRIFGVFAVYVAAAPDGTVISIGVSRDLDRSRTKLRESKGEGVDITAAYWTVDRSNAVVIASTVLDYKDADGKITAERARRAIEYVASAKGIPITNHDVAIQRVKAAVDRIDDRIEKAHEAGHLKVFNRAFKAYRAMASHAGRKAMSYVQARAALRRALIGRLVAGSKADIEEDVVAEVFASAIEEFSREAV